MTLRYLYNGVEQTNTATRIKGPASSVTARADGDVASGEAVIKDPTGALGYDLLRTFQIVEDACVPAPILFTGMIYNIRVGRGEYTTGPGREWTFTFTDLNGLLHERVFNDKTAKRPKETGNARLAWLMASPLMAGRVYDHGEISSLPDMYDEDDFRGHYASDVVTSLLVSSVTDDAMTFFVYLDQASGQPSLFLQPPVATTHNSTLRISNVPGDYDGVTWFRPVPGPEVELAGEEIYDGVYFTTKNGSIYRTRPATFTAYPRHRDGTFSTDRITLGDTAERHAKNWLNLHSVRRDTLSLTVRLPRDKVGLIQAGQRLPVRMQHLPGYEAAKYTRVTAATIPISEGQISHYDLQLELSTRGLFPAPGGSPGSYPKPPPLATHYYAGSMVFNSDGYGSAGGPGSIPALAPDHSVSSTNTALAHFAAGTSYNWSATIHQDPAGDNPPQVGLMDVLGNWHLPHVTGSGPGTQTFSGTFDPATTGSGSSFDAYLVATTGALGHPPGGRPTPVEWVFDPVGWVSPIDDPPLPGQWVYNEIPTPAPDGTTTTFTVRGAYVPHSLRVRVDGVPILNGLTETNPDAGTFSLDFAPLPAVGAARAEIVTVDYQSV